MFKNQKAFTLVEMLFVLLIISVLIILIVPSLTSKSTGVQDQGCKALVQVVQAQVDTYYLNEHTLPESIKALADASYITDDQTSCANGNKLTMDDKGHVSVSNAGQ